MGGAVGSHLVVATANTSRHMRSIAKAVITELKQRQVVVFGKAPVIEGAKADDWMLVDGGDVVLNVFTHQARNMYDLETHWREMGAG